MEGLAQANGLTYLYFGVNPWQSIKQRSQQLARGLSVGNRVVYVNPIPPGIPHRARRSENLPSHEICNSESSLERHLFRSRKVNDNLIAIDVPGLPGSHIFARLHEAQYKLLCRFLFRELGRQHWFPDVLWLSHPRQASAIRLISAYMVLCYDCLDDHPRMARASQRGYLVRNEEQILARADVVFATSRALEEKCRVRAPRVIRIPNGVDPDHFAAPEQETPTRRRSESSPVLGYFGWVGP